MKKFKVGDKVRTTEQANKDWVERLKKHPNTVPHAYNRRDFLPFAGTVVGFSKDNFDNRYVIVNDGSEDAQFGEDRLELDKA